MSVRTPTQAPIPTPPSEPYPWRVGLALVALALLLGAVFYGGIQLVNRTAARDQESVVPTETAIAIAVATAAAAPTRTPVPQSTTAPQATTAAQPTTAPMSAVAPVLTTPPAATNSPTAGATSQATIAPTAEPTVFAPTVTPVESAVADEVRPAYLHYFDVRDKALYTNDPTGLDAVAADPALAGLEQEIADDQTQGKAQVVNVAHRYSIVHIEGDPDDIVAVADYYKDLSYWVDATSHEPLPGQNIPSSPAEAPQVNAVYRMRNIDGVWKVVEGFHNVGHELSP